MEQLSKYLDLFPYVSHFIHTCINSPPGSEEILNLYNGLSAEDKVNALDLLKFQLEIIEVEGIDDKITFYRDWIKDLQNDKK